MTLCVMKLLYLSLKDPQRLVSCQRLEHAAARPDVVPVSRDLISELLQYPASVVYTEGNTVSKPAQGSFGNCRGCPVWME